MHIWKCWVQNSDILFRNDFFYFLIFLAHFMEMKMDMQMNYWESDINFHYSIPLILAVQLKWQLDQVGLEYRLHSIGVEIDGGYLDAPQGDFAAKQASVLLKYYFSNHNALHSDQHAWRR